MFGSVNRFGTDVCGLVFFCFCFVVCSDEFIARYPPPTEADLKQLGTGANPESSPPTTTTTISAGGVKLNTFVAHHNRDEYLSHMAGLHRFEAHEESEQQKQEKANTLQRLSISPGMLLLEREEQEKKKMERRRSSVSTPRAGGAAAAATPRSKPASSPPAPPPADSS